MPIIQISKMQQRRGLKQDLPELSEGELALAVDTGEVFIGTPGLPSIVRDLTTVLWQQNKLYYVGNYVSYSGILYRANTTHTSSTTFNTANWDKVDSSDYSNSNTRVLTEYSKNIENILKYSYLNRNTTINSDRQPGFAFHEIGNFYDDLPEIWPYQAIRRVNSPTANDYDEIGVRRYLQERLDERVSVLSYGASGNGRRYIIDPVDERARNDMDAEANSIRRATIALANTYADSVSDYNVNDKNKALYFPAGTYVVNKQLFLTKRTNWVGDGAGKTRIIFNIKDLVLDENSNCLLTTIDPSVPYDEIVDDTKTSEYLYQNISDILNDITVSGISFELLGDPSIDSSVLSADILRLIRARNVTFYNCAFIGSWKFENFHTGNYDFTKDSQAVSIDSVSSSNILYCGDIKFLNCKFSQFYYATLLTDYMENVAFEGCNFSNLYRGIVVSEPTSGSETWATYPDLTDDRNGPRNVRILNNKFTHIASNGAIVYRGYAGDGTDKSATYSSYVSDERLTGAEPYLQSSGISFAYNNWENIGNYNAATLVATSLYEEDPQVPVITFSSGSTYNMVIGDTFARDVVVDPANKNTHARVWYDINDPNIVFIPQDTIKIDLADPTKLATISPSSNFVSTSPAILLGLSQGSEAYNSWQITYTCVYDDYNGLKRRRTGTLDILLDPTTDQVTFSEDYIINNGPDELTFDVSVNTDNAVEVKAKFLNSASDPLDITIYYKVEKLYSPV